MNIVHLSYTPLAGAPIRLVTAINHYTNIKSRLIVLKPNIYGSRTFPNDLIWEKDKEIAIELIEEADILHYHHDQLFINSLIPEINSYIKKKTRILRQHHSAPNDLRKKKSLNAEIVIPHYPERYFPQARLVPNIIDVDFMKKFIKKKDEPYDIVFCPSMPKTNAYKERWSTKAAPEVINILKRFINNKIEIVFDRPFSEAINARANSKIVIDDTVTGSIHQGGLEAAALGILTVCHIDRRMEYTLKNLTGSDKLPFISTKLENLANCLNELLNLTDVELKEIGSVTKKWMEQYYAPKILIQNYVECYQDLLVSEEFFKKKSKLLRKKDSSIKSFYYNFISEYDWHKRRILSLIKP